MKINFYRTLFNTCLILFIILTGCATKNKSAIVIEESQPFDYSIALVADSQFQSTESAVYRPIWKNAIVDKFIDVTIRTPAQNYLAEESLRYLINKTLSKSNPDIILYLGDGANNGCRDEITKLFSVLTEYQNNGEAIFFVIGNHDYLGAGNTSSIKSRNDLCTSEENSSTKILADNVLTKFELMRIIHNFNVKSASNIASSGYSFVDNFKDSLEIICKTSGYRQHHADGCFYSGYITNGQLEVLLIDTSNYGTADVKPFAAGELEFAGTFGGICCKDIGHGQWDWFSKTKLFSKELAISIFASHYPPVDLPVFNDSAKSAKSDFARKAMRHSQNRKVAPLINLINQKNSMRYWLSAHTHTKEYSARDPVQVTQYRGYKRKALKKNFNSFNVGSTTDYIQHMLLINFETNANVAQMIPIIENEDVKFCKELIEKIEANAFELNKTLPVNGQSKGASIFGLTKDYRNWNEIDYNNSDKNIEKLIAALNGQDLSIACLADFAASNEKND